MASYKLSPEPPGSNESHQIRTREALQNLPIREALALAQQRATRQNVFYPEKYGAKKLGAGEYGTVYLVKMTNELFWELSSIYQHGGGKIITQFPPVSTPVVIKIAKQGSGSDSDFYKENVKEGLVHKRLYVAPCLQIGTKPLCVSKYVPKFYMSCVIGKPRNLRAVTVMDSAGNTDLDKYVRGKSIPVELFVEIERAICSMWLAGYIHGDLHRANIMLDTRTNAVKIIDFGFALKLPPPFVAVLGRRIYNKIARGDLDSLGDIWTQKPIDGKRRLINYTNGVMKAKGYPWYNPDYKILRTLWNQVPRKLRSQIPAARSAAWGIPIGAQQPRPQLRPQSRPQSRPKSRSQSFLSSPILNMNVAGKTLRNSGTAPRIFVPTQKSSSESAKRAESAKKKEELRRAESAKKKEELRRAESAKKKEELRRAESAKKKEELRRAESAKKKEEIRRAESAKKKEELRRAESAKKKEELRRAESAKKKEELRRAESAKKQEEIRRAESAKRAESARRKQQVSRQSPRRSSPSSPGTPSTKSPPRAFFTPSSRKFSDANRAVAYHGGDSQKIFADIERQKSVCRQRGMTYNPITKQCSSKTPVMSSGKCRIDCARIGKRCGPRGKCIKL